MLNRIFTIKQIHLAKELIKEDTLSSFRLAFLLLDNSVETLMYRYIDMHLLNRHIKKKKIKMPYEFPKKTELIVQSKTIDKSIADFINFAHQYRNEIYHHDKVRVETIKPVVKILFKVVCDLFKILDTEAFLFIDNNNEDMKWLYTNFGFTTSINFDKESFSNIVKTIASDINIENLEIKKCLYDHLINRLIDIESLIDIIIYDNKEITSKNKETDKAIKYIYDFDLVTFKKKVVKKAKEIIIPNNEVISINNFIKLENEIEDIENKVLPEVEDLEMYLDAMYEAWKESLYENN